MGVTADDGHAREGESPLRTHDVDDSVARIHHSVVGEPELLHIPGKLVHLLLRNGIFYRLVLVVGRGVVVRHAYDLLRPEALDAPLPEAFESLGAGDFVAVEPVYIELSGTVLDHIHHVGVPDLVKQCVHLRFS